MSPETFFKFDMLERMERHDPNSVEYKELKRGYDEFCEIIKKRSKHRKIFFCIFVLLIVTFMFVD